MSNLNLKTLDTVSITEVKEIDEFLKLYNSSRELPQEEIKSQIINASNGKITENTYDELLNKAKTYTKNHDIPSQIEWEQVRAIYREVGNNKIAQTKEQIENLAKKYTGTVVVNNKQQKKSYKQVAEDTQNLSRKVETVKALKVVLTIVMGIAGFVVLTVLSKLILPIIFTKASNMISQIIVGVISICGLLIGSYIANKIMDVWVGSVKKDRELAEITYATHHEAIVKLQTEIKAVEANKRKLESQYGVEILAKTDFTSDLKLKNQEVLRSESVDHATDQSVKTNKQTGTKEEKLAENKLASAEESKQTETKNLSQKTKKTTSETKKKTKNTSEKTVENTK